MKRIIAMVLMLMMLTPSFIYANDNSSNTVTMLMNGRKTNFHTAELIMFGEKVQSDVPPVLHNSRTLLPLRLVAENMGAQVHWNQQERTVTIATGDKEILLIIDNPVAKVNGAQANLPDAVPPKIFDYKGSGRTMVPIRFVAEVLGLEVDWHDATNTVSISRPAREENIGGDVNVVENIRFVRNGAFSEVRIKTDQGVQLKTSKLVNPNRLVFDFENTKLNTSFNRQIGEMGITNIRASQFNNSPLTTRLVIELGEDKNHRLHYDDATGEMVVSFTNYVNNVIRETIDMKEAIVIEGDYLKNYNIKTLDNPDRLIVDIKDAFLDSTKVRNLTFESNAMKGVRISEFKPDHHYNPEDKIVRVVLDLQESYDANKMEYKVEEDRMVIFLEGKPLEALKYEAANWTTSTLSLTSNVVTNYDFTATHGGRRLQIAIPKRDIDLSLETITMDDHLIDKIIIDEDSRSNEYIVEIQLKEGTKHKVLSSTRSNTFSIELSNEDLKYSQLLVVIDPGHGGTDPGAISRVSGVSGLRESDVALDVSRRLNKLLQEAGFRTHMTREGDSTVSLGDRAKVANQMQADLFISVHANAFTSESANGIETLYYASERNPADPRDNRRVAQIFQNEMVKTLKRRDRGLMPVERIVVLRDTKMPAVLTEIGFMTNPEEARLLATDNYRQLAAEAMFKATVQYFEEVNK